MLNVMYVFILVALVVLVVEYVHLQHTVNNLRRAVDVGLLGLEAQFDELSLMFAEMTESPTTDQVESARYSLIGLMNELEHFQKAM